MKKRRKFFFFCIFIGGNVICQSATAHLSTEYITGKTYDAVLTYLNKDQAFATRYYNVKDCFLSADKLGEIMPELDRLVSESQDISPEVHVHMLALLADYYSYADSPRREVETLDSMRKTDVFSAEDAEEMAYWIDVDTCQILTYTRSTKESFQPTMSEIDSAYENLFSRYSPYRYEILRGHYQYAMAAYRSASRLQDDHYYLVALDHLREVHRIAQEVLSRPSLAEDEAILNKATEFERKYVNSRYNFGNTLAVWRNHK